MKKTMKCLLALLCMVGLFASCSKDKTEMIGDELNGVYKGTLDITQDGNEVGTGVAQKVYITKVGENVIKMELKNFSFMGMTLGTISIDRNEVDKNGDVCTFVGSQKLDLNAIGSCDVALIGTITGGKTIQMAIQVGASLGGTPIVVDVEFSGTKLSADQSSEAAIKTVAFSSAVVTSQPVINDKTITFMVANDAKPEELKLTPTITVSDKATISPASGVEQDFSKAVTYTVTSEDGIVINTYTVSVAGKAQSYDFEEWVEGVKGQTPEKTYYKPAVPVDFWDSSNAGVQLLKGFGVLSASDPYCVTQTNDAYTGKSAAAIMTVDTKGKDMIIAKVPKVTSGSLFNGAFSADLSNTLKSTKFGTIWTVKPVAVKGFFKYTPGKDYYYCADPTNAHLAVLDNTKTDGCSLAAVLYTVTSDKLDECLTGVNVYTETSRIVAMAKIEKGATAAYTPFELKLDYKQSYDPTLKYRLALIFSASKDGDKFSGAPGSTLIVDDVEVISE